MPRITLPTPESYTPEQQRIHTEVVAGRGRLFGPYRAALLRPELAERWHRLSMLFGEGGRVPRRLRELALLVCARFWNAKVEWWAHAPIALKEGVSMEVIEAMRTGDRPKFTVTDEQAVYDFCTEMLEHHNISQPTYDRALDILDPVGIVELGMALGHYTMAAFTLIAHEIPIPDQNMEPYQVLPEIHAPNT